MQDSPLVYFNKIPLPIIAIGKKETITWVGSHFSTKYSLDSQRLIGKTFDSIFEIKSNNSPIPFRSLESPTRIFEVTINGKRNLGWFKINRIPIKTKFFQEIILFRDISEYINDIQERVNSELNYHTIFQNAPYSNVLLKLDGIVMDCNYKTGEIFGLPVEDMIGRAYKDLIDISTDLYNFYEDLAENIRSGEEALPFPTEIKTLEGNHKFLEVFPSLIRKNNQPHAIHLIIHDLTEEKKTEQKLSESITVFAAFMENFSGVAFIKSPEGRYIYLNKTLQNLINQAPQSNYSYEECLTKSDFDFFSEEDAKNFRKNDLQVINTRTAAQLIETTNVKGILRYWFVNKFPIANDGEAPWAVAGMGVDITNQKESEYSLKIQRDFGLSLNEVNEPDELFNLCIDSAMKVPEIDLIGVYLLNKKTKDYELKYSKGASAQFVEKVRVNQFRRNNESIFKDKKPIYRDFEHITKSGNSIIIEERIKSYCIIPLIIENQGVGAFNVASRNYESISKQTGNILELISSQLGATMQKIWAQDKIKLNETRLEALLEINQMQFESENEIYDIALKQGIKLTRSSHGFIAHINNSQVSLMRMWSIHAKNSPPQYDKPEDSMLSDGDWAKIIRNRIPVIVNSKEESETQTFFTTKRTIFRYLVIPIIMSNEIIAITGVFNKEEDYDDSDANQLALLIEGVVGIIQKNQDEKQREIYRSKLEKTVEQIKLNERRLETLLKLNQMTDEPLDEIYNFTLKQCVKISQSASGFLALLSSDGKMKFMRVWSKGIGKSPKFFEMPEQYQDLNKGVWVEVIHDKKPVIVNDTSVSDIAQRLLPPNPPVSRYMLIPISIRDQLFAVAGLGNKEDEYEESDVKQITLILENVASLIQKRQDEEQHQFYKREIEKNEKINALGILAGGIAHDFNNILTAILGNISLAEMAENLGEYHERLNEAKKAIIRSKELTQQLLAFSKGGEPIKKLSSIDLLLRETTDFAIRGSNVKAEYDFPTDLWPAEVDQGQISQVINNLVLNAIQAMPNGGTLYIQANNKVLRDDSKLPLSPGDYVVFQVKDEGVGIPSKYVDQIFDPYFTTKEKGSGLGLATTFAICTNHGGYITVKSKVGEGSTFNVFLPAIRNKQPEEVSKMMDDLFYGSGKILVMDDEEIIRKVVKRMLEKLGYEVFTTADGNETIQLFKKEKQSGKPFDLVVLDLTIPGGMGGKETVKKLKKINPEIKAVVSSGYSVDPIMGEYESHGFQGIIVKPFKIEDLSKIITSVLNS